MEPDNLENRVSSLEVQVGGLTERVEACEHDSSAARTLASAADRDVTVITGELRDFRRATVVSFNAMRQDFTALRADVTTLRADVDRGFAEMDRGFAEMDRGFAEMDRGFIEIRGRLDGTAAGLQHIADLIENLSGT